MSDSSLFHYIEAQYESNKGSPYFVWTATMQNHGPYDDLSSVPSEVTFEGYNNNEALQYINSIYQSDKALGELTDYFRNKDEEVIIVMFGDHYPHIFKLYRASLWQGRCSAFNGGLLKTSTDSFPYLEQQGR